MHKSLLCGVRELVFVLQDCKAMKLTISLRENSCQVQLKKVDLLEDGTQSVLMINVAVVCEENQGRRNNN